jgi:hypothetical protein
MILHWLTKDDKLILLLILHWLTKDNKLILLTPNLLVVAASAVVMVKTQNKSREYGNQSNKMAYLSLLLGHVIDVWSANQESVTDCITFRIDTWKSLYPFRNIIMYCELLFT